MSPDSCFTLFRFAIGNFSVDVLNGVLQGVDIKLLCYPDMDEGCSLCLGKRDK